MEANEENELTKLLAIEPNYLINYITDLVVENSDSIRQCIETYDRDWLASIIERHIY